MFQLITALHDSAFSTWLREAETVWAFPTVLTVHTFGMHENRLYILEATVPGNAPPPALFQQSMGILDKDGVRVRYDSVYSNAYPAPKRIEGGPNRPMGCD